MSGILYVVATPIGNLKDISQRALETFEQVDWIAAEDTRHTRQFLQHFGIQKPLISLHGHNEQVRTQALLPRLLEGEQGALVSDAGTPLISDPGAVFVRTLRQAGVRVTPVPGPSAVVAALSAAGLPTEKFAFIGFLPSKPGQRQRALYALKGRDETLVFYEAPHRLMDMLEAAIEVWGPQHACVVARELTKKFEQFVGETLEEVITYFKDHADKVRGEFVVLLGPDASLREVAGLSEVQLKLIESLLMQNMPPKTVVDVLTQVYGLRKNEVYSIVQRLKNT